ncbi:MAG: heparan-alpha-glucosaminide N-acetyltransferase [Peredibacter sp.]
MNQLQDTDKRNSRFPLVDYTRALAVYLMVIFHLSFDLKIFGFAQIDFQRNLFWWSFPRVIVFLFLFSMGMSFEISFEKGLNTQKFFKRVGKIVFCAALITLFTYFAYPSRWIYFGTLHCIAICSFFAVPFRARPRTALAFSLIILAPLLWGYRWPWIKLEHASLDYIPALPWMGVVLLGMAAKNFGLHQVTLPSIRFITLTSKHSLYIYLLHQPLLYGLVYLFYTW